MLVYADGDYESSETVGWAARAARATGVPLVVTRTWSPGLGEFRSEARDATRRRLLRELQSWAQPAVDFGLRPRLVVSEGETGTAVLEQAQASDAGLVVIAASEKAEVTRLLAMATLPVAVIPVPGGARSTARVLVGVDGSSSARAACEWTAEFAAHTGASVDAVTVFEPLVEWVPATNPTGLVARLREELAGPWTAPLRASSVQTSTQVIEAFDVMGEPVRFAHRHRHDLVVVGHDRGAHHPWRRPFGIRLLHDAHLPVVMVPAE